MPVLPSDSGQRRRSSASQQQQGASSCPQGGQQQPPQGVFAQQGACVGGQQQGVYATSLQGVNGQQEQSQRAYSSCQKQEQYSLSPHAPYRNSYSGPGPGVWVGEVQHQGP